ncbi:MAG: GAF and ANTAR domain-containing protein [Ilumatobacteraceae bacterium]
MADPRDVRSDRESRIVDAFVRLADTLVEDYDVIDFLHFLVERCVELIDVDEAAIMLVSPAGVLQPVAASTERGRLLELFEIQNQDGPCLDAYRHGTTVMSADLNDDYERWPIFTPQAIRVGFRAVHSVPLRLRSNIIGALNLLRLDTGELSLIDSHLVRALSDIATVGLIQERTISAAHSTQSALETALTSRVRIEQAKGMMSERGAITVDEAFGLLRSYARSNRIGLSVVAAGVVNRELDIVPRSPLA